MMWPTIITVLLGVHGVFGATVIGESRSETKWPGSYPGVTFEELQPKVLSGDVFLLDVRTRSELLNPGRLPNSLNLPLQELDEALQLEDQEFLETYGFNLPEDREMIVMCRSGARSQVAAEKLARAGYTNTRLYYGSFIDWIRHNAPISRQISFTEFQSLTDTAQTEASNTRIAIIDVRTQEQRNRQGHIAGSLNLPLEALESALSLPSPEFLSRFGFSKPTSDTRLIIIGADGNQVQDSVPLFNTMGYYDLRLYLG